MFFTGYKEILKRPRRLGPSISVPEVRADDLSFIRHAYLSVVQHNFYDFLIQHEAVHPVPGAVTDSYSLFPSFLTEKMDPRHSPLPDWMGRRSDRSRPRIFQDLHSSARPCVYPFPRRR